jgi:hypothetical protein
MESARRVSSATGTGSYNPAPSSPVRHLQKAGHHPHRLPQRQLEQNLDRQTELDRSIREHRRAVGAAVMPCEPGHLPCLARSAASRACAARRCGRTSRLCGSGRVLACSYGPSNRMDSRCESSTLRVVQQRCCDAASPGSTMPHRSIFTPDN